MIQEGNKTYEYGWLDKVVRVTENGKTLAARLQDSLNILNIVEVGRGFSSLGGDYYILNCSAYPSAIVECGFLSNAEDEKLLLSEDYRKKLVKAIADGLDKVLYVDFMKARKKSVSRPGAAVMRNERHISE